jgi:hypothetical protein
MYLHFSFTFVTLIAKRMAAAAEEGDHFEQKKAGHSASRRE